MRAQALGLSRIVRHYSQAPKSQSALWGQFSIVLSRSPSKSSAIRELVQYIESRKSFSKHLPYDGRSSLVVLASKDLASWLEDPDFIPELLKSLRPREPPLNTSKKPGARLKRPTVDVLSGVMDGLVPKSPKGKPKSGLAFLVGSQGLLPGLWDKEAPNPAPKAEKSASISFCAAFPGRPSNSGVTFPLANTIFVNGRRSTLTATRYTKDEETDSWYGSTPQSKVHQNIEFSSDQGPLFQPTIPLLALTTPRKIVSGLGNIVKLIEIKGVSSPASTDLEVRIPHVINYRSERGYDFAKRPFGVWAVVVPEEVMQTGLMRNLKIWARGTGSTEPLFEEIIKNLQLLGVFDMRVYRVLSGGGGWGAKQGLLSLDPETSYTISEQDSMEMFIKAFQKKETLDGPEGPIRPGSYIWFGIEPYHRRMKGGEHYNRSGIWLGSIAAEEDVLAPGAETESESKSQKPKREDKEPHAAQFITSAFIAASSAGLYMKLDTPGYYSAIKSYPFTTKIDVPHSLLYHPGAGRLTRERGEEAGSEKTGDTR
ncbi:uncharacterized protein JN550_012754 [Neoarthrinium moseri]|uniref:uncharacterized protein n=1 Tax=Neoarthrinium moseri TaxID=1658444 RepID=UPI001FDBE554|nr:uncharacterized protein JN550_012754 [Neoarthrinium moseri]KAI1858389.1 hypothetical protein JN550_012754 [Neoarthrinium moseri]